MFKQNVQCRSGVLDGSLAARFAAVALWNLQLASYPGTTSQLCNFLARQHQLTTVDVSLTHVRIPSVTVVGCGSTLTCGTSQCLSSSPVLFFHQI